ncbi:MAG: GldG family protein [Nitrospinae bacterium]|nr:GldG family protein [Nitrospinota bacterium]
MKIKRLHYKTNSILMIIILIGIIAIINFLSGRHFIRWDLTEGKEFTIATATKKIVGELDDIVNINVYFSRELPSHLADLERQIKDILSEYKAYAGRNLMIDYIDPSEDPQLERKVQMLGIPQIQLNVIEKDRAQVRNAYMGIAVLYEDKKEVIPLVQNVVNLEYDLTSAINKVTSEEVKGVGFLYGTDDMEERYSSITTELKKGYKVSKVDIRDGKKIKDDIDTLVLVSPRDMKEREKYEIDQFLMRGGRLILLVDPVTRETNGLSASILHSGIDDMLSHYGIKINKDLVLDSNSEYATFQSGFMRFSVPYPFWPKISTQGFINDHPIVNRLGAIVFPWTASIEILKEKTGDSKVTELIKSSDRSWTQTGYFNLSPPQRFNVESEKMKSYTLAALLSGRFKSFYAGKDIPATEGKEENTNDSNKGNTINPEKEERVNEGKDTHILVIGNSNFIADEFIGQAGGNLTFFMNSIDWLTIGDELIGIRSRRVTDRPLKEISEYKKGYIKFTVIFSMSMVLICLGLVRFYLRKRWINAKI